MPFGDQPAEEEIKLLYKGLRSTTLSVAASDTQDTSGCDYICDGTDDQVEINQAIAALPAGGGLIHLLEGTYTLNAQITLASNVAIIGTGANTVITIPNGFNANINLIHGDTISNVLIKDLRIDGNRANQTAGAMYGIHFHNIDHSKIVDCWLEEVYGADGIHLINASNYNTVVGNTCYHNASDGINLHTSNHNTVTGNTCQDNSNNGMDILAGSNYNTITGNTVQGNTVNGIYVRAESDDNTFTGNTCQGNGASGINLNDSDDNTITGNTCQGNGIEGIFVNSSVGNTVTGNTCQGNGDNGIVVAIISDDNTITGNTCEGNGDNGIYLVSCNHSLIADNEVINNGLDADATYDGIYLINASYNSIQGNLVRTTVAAPPPNRQRYGINVSNAACTGNLVANNDLYQSGQTGGYNDAGTDTRGTVTGEVSPTGNTLVVAASDSLDPVRADFYCDNVSDETEINAAITALGATGGTVKLLEGTFTVDGDIVLASNIALVGQGAGTVITIPNGHDVNINIIYATGRTQVMVKDLRIDGNRAAQAAGTMHGIYFDTVTYSKIVNCWVEDMYVGNGIYLTDASHYNTIEGNTCDDSAGNGIGLGMSSHNTVTGNTCRGNDLSNIQLAMASDNTVVGNVCQGGDRGIRLITDCDRNTITGNYCHGHILDGIDLSEADDNTITGNTCQGCGDYGIGLNTSVGNTVTGNTCEGNSHNGIHLTAASHYNTIDGNTCRGNGYNGIYLNNSSHNGVVGNSTTSNSQDADDTHAGIWVDAASTYNAIQANKSHQGVGANQQRYGIRIDDVAGDGTFVHGNDMFNGGNTADYSDVGGQAVVTVYHNNRTTAGWVP